MKTGSCKHAPGRFRPILTTVVVIVLLAICWIGLEVYYAYTARPGPAAGWVGQYRAHTESIDLYDPEQWNSLAAILDAHEQARTELWAPDSPFSIASSPAGGFIRPYSTLLEPDQDALDTYFSKMDEFGYTREEAAFIRAESSRQYEVWLRNFQADPVWERVIALQNLRSATPEAMSIAGMWEAGFQLSQQGRELLTTLESSMVLAKMDGEFERFTDCYEAAMALGWCFGSQPILVSRLTGSSIQGSIRNKVAYAADQGLLPEKALTRIQRAREGWEFPDRFYSIEGERLLTLECLDKVYDQRGRRLLGGPHAPLHVQPGSFLRAAPTSWLENMKAIWHPRREKMIDRVNGLFSDIVTFHQMPLRKQLLLAETGTLAKALKKADEDMALQGIKTVGSPLSYALDELNDLGFGVTLVLAAYRNENGQLPDTLDQLVPLYLEELPVDPLHPDAAALLYTRDADRVGDYRAEVRYLLYSVGLDGVDNGGTPPQRAMSESLRPSGRGTDYILNDPDWR